MRKSIAAIGLFSAACLGWYALPPFEYADAAAPPPSTELRVLGPNQYLPGAWSGLRVISYDPVSGHSVPDVPVEIRLGDRRLFEGKTDHNGTVDGRFQVPQGLSGTAVLHVLSPGLDLSAPVTIQEERRLYLTTDKPLYQPGQSVHMRLLGLSAPELTPLGQVSCTITVSDPRGNVVFKQSRPTSRFGVASARFDLASEVNLGEYRVQVTCGTCTATRSFTVKRYVLPRFKVAVTTDRTWYRPGERVHGHVQAGYFFGKPVAHGRVALHVRTFDTGEHVLEELEGTTDADGAWTFDFTLPAHFTGRPLDNAAPLDLVADVVDTANHQEVGPLALSVVSRPMAVDFFPEGGSLIPGLTNRIYVVASYPDGKAARCLVSLRVNGEVQTVQTDETGFGEATVKPVAARSYYRGETAIPLSWEAFDAQGSHALGSGSLNQRMGSDSVLVHLDKALYRVGDALQADVYSTRESATVYVDAVRDHQTLLTQAVDLHQHHAHVILNLGPDDFGALTLHAYEISADQNVVRDSRQVFVQPARELTVEVKADRDEYRPGQDAHLTFLVKTAQGAPRLAVLGVDMVDESLFSLADREPGLEKVYFLLEKAMLEPRYEVHGFAFRQAVEDPTSSARPETQKLSLAALSRADTSTGFSLDLSSYQVRVQQLMGQLQRVQGAVSTWMSRHGRRPDDIRVLVSAGLIKASDARDPWGHLLVLQANGLVISVGPDGKAGTPDDVTMYNGRFGLENDMVMDREMPMGAVRGGVAPPPMAANMAVKAQKASATSAPVETRSVAAPVRVREYFPETLYSNPEVVTDENGRATLTVPLADSITTWRMSAFASSIHGELGNAAAQVKVFQPFFVDIDLPTSLTEDDEVSVPVAVYNYLPEPQTVTLRLDEGGWFKALDGAERTVHLTRNQVSVVYYRIRTDGLGIRSLTVHADGTHLSDAIRRTVEVTPNGQAFDNVMSDRLSDGAERTFNIPKDAIPGASKLLLTVYPGVFAQVMEGVDAIFRMPNGCFEQTSSTTYPNVLVMDYLKKLHKLTPETGMKADGYINTGYQRLLTFEVKGGGFSVFGQYPGNPILTAYGLMEFADMAKVHEVDPNLIGRTRGWLLAQQKPDGSWSAGREGFYAEGWSNVPNSDLVATSYITWALLQTGDRSPQVLKAVAYVREHLGQVTEPYTAALVANTLSDAKDEMAGKALSRLAAMAVQDKDALFWPTRIATAAFGTGPAGDVETTALAALALENDPRYSNEVNRAMTYLTRCKDRYGTWSSTQATVLAMKAMIGSIDKARETANATVQVEANGKMATVVHITPETSEVFHQIDLTPYLHGGENDVRLVTKGEGNCQYKLVGTVYRPWSLVGASKKEEPLGLSVKYDRTHLATDDVADCEVAVQNRTAATANQVVVGVGIPPGFEVQSEDLEAMVEKHVIAKFSNTGRQIIIYFEKLNPSKTVTLSYRVKARLPIRAVAPESQAYEYYDPTRQVSIPPIPLEVTRR